MKVTCRCHDDALAIHSSGGSDRRFSFGDTIRQHGFWLSERDVVGFSLFGWSL
jgi:hypothetical protein